MLEREAGLREVVLTKDELNAHPINISYGLPTPEAGMVCRTRFTRDVAKVTLEVADPEVLLVVKDVKASFTAKVGVVGMPSIHMLVKSGR